MTKDKHKQLIENSLILYNAAKEAHIKEITLHLQDVKTAKVGGQVCGFFMAKEVFFDKGKPAVRCKPMERKDKDLIMFLEDMNPHDVWLVFLTMDIKD